MKWDNQREDLFKARCGHLYVRIEDESDYADTDEEKARQFKWYVEPDNEDKCYRRAIAGGESPTLEAAKAAVFSACNRLIAAMTKDLNEQGGTDG